MDLFSKRVEAGLENSALQTNFSTEELENIVRSVVKEELAVAAKDIKGTIEKIINESLNNEASNSIMQLSASSKFSQT